MHYVLILIGKIIEITIMTLRIVLISKGERKIGTMLSFFEIVLWLTIVSQVLSNLSEDPLSAVVYALGFTLGSYLGSILEGRLGIGTAQVQLIASKSKSEELCDAIYNAGYAYTRVEGRGKKAERIIIYTLLPRNAVNKMLKEVKSISDGVLISVHETKPYMGGFGLKRR